MSIDGVLNLVTSVKWLRSLQISSLETLRLNDETFSSAEAHEASWRSANSDRAIEH